MMRLEPLEKYGQIKEGDLVLFELGSVPHAKRAVQIIHGGAENEEVVLDKRTNQYFITQMVLNGASWAKDVQIVKGRFP